MQVCGAFELFPWPHCGDFVYRKLPYRRGTCNVLKTNCPGGWGGGVRPEIDGTIRVGFGDR